MIDETLLQAGLDWLYRDQRTVKTPCTTHCRHTKLRAGDYLTVCVCVLLLCTGGMSAPTGKPLWENPCGHKHMRSDSSEQLPIVERLEPLLVASKNALTKAQMFSEQWVGKVFQPASILDHHNDWASATNDWLPSKEQLPKSFGERLSQERLEKIMEKPLTDTLKLVHKNMQIYAVGLEQAYHDQKSEDGWASNFRQMQIENKQVLCELETVLLSHDIKELDTVQREAMAHHFEGTSGSETATSLRDWFILRDFITNLEYIVELCDFVVKLESQSP